MVVGSERAPRRPQLRGLQDGTVTLAFRRWTTPRVRVGTLQRTRVGVVEVTSVERVPVGPDGKPAVSDDEARLAGMASPERVLARGAGREGDLYRVGLRLAGRTRASRCVGTRTSTRTPSSTSTPRWRGRTGPPRSRGPAGTSS